MALLYLGCVIVMATAGHDGAVKFFNSLLHSLDVSTIVRMNVSLGEAAIGLVETFVLGWLFRACVAAFYNSTIRK